MKRQRFQNMVFDTYDKLAKHINEYRQTLTELTEEQETIREEINLFYRKNDIDTILSFIRRLDNPDSSILNMMQPAENGGHTRGLRDQLRLHPPLPTCEILPTIPAIPDRKQIKRQLVKIIHAAFQNSENSDVKTLVKHDHYN